MTKKLNLNSGTIEATMLGPLWARATYSKLYPDLLNDPKASKIIKDLDYDFSEVQEFLDEWRGLGLLVRAKSFEIASKIISPPGNLPAIALKSVEISSSLK